MNLFKFRTLGILSAVLGGVFALSSCGDSYQSLTPTVLQQRGLRPGEGLIVGKFSRVSSGTTTPIGPEGALIASSADSGSKEIFGIKETATRSPDLGMFSYLTAIPNADGVFAMPVKAGTYEIIDWSISAATAGGSMTVRSRLPMHVPFEVKEGKATYIGRANILTRNGRNLLGLPVFGDGLILLTDKFQEDAATISKVFPSIHRSQCVPSNVPQAYLREMKRISTSKESNSWFR